MVILRLAGCDIELAYQFAQRVAPAAAANWLAGLLKTVNSLSQQPQRCGRIWERLRLSEDLRELHYGRYPNVYRLIFTIKDDEVRVLRVIRSQRRLRGRDVELGN